MDFVKLYSRAKINIALDVLNKLDNNYHSLKMIMQSTRLSDTVYIRKIPQDDIIIRTNIPWLPTDSRNIVYKTAEMLKTEYEIKEGVSILLLKSIPISAGLAGGSSNCAAALLGIRNLFKLPISNEDLLKKSASLGADVPFCLARGTMLSEGIGEILTPLKPFPKCYIVISKPNINVSTASIFSSLDLNNIKREHDVEKIIYYLNKGDLRQISANMFNVLENVTINKYPSIQTIKNIMIKNNALGSIMTGSGSAVFGIWGSKIEAIKTAKELKYKYNIKETFVTRPFNAYHN